MNFPVAFTEMKKIPLTKGRIARVDSDDFDELNRHSWYYGSRGYACRGQGSWRKREHKILYMHREIVGDCSDNEIDHYDGNGINNRRSNFRLCNHAENRRNSKIYSTNRSGFRGVHWDKERRRFVASIKLNGTTVFLGRFKTVEEAVSSRERAAKQHWGEYAPHRT